MGLRLLRHSAVVKAGAVGYALYKKSKKNRVFSWTASMTRRKVAPLSSSGKNFMDFPGMAIVTRRSRTRRPTEGIADLSY